MSNTVNLGIGYLGMLYTAPEGTTIPNPGDSLASWTEVGAISDEGIEWDPHRDNNPIRDWTKKIRRVAAQEEGGTIKGKLIETTKKVFEFLYGEDNVSYQAATSQHGNITSVDVGPGVSAPPAAYLFLVKDGDDLIQYATKSGVVRELDPIAVAPGDPIAYGFTIESDCWRNTKDDGQLTS